ncbi:FHA domain-containing protein [Streptomyces sp. HUAS ZL42]|uniref:FHA domain-containing protein n=1 Tax=Streptomyces sp. HUAS ZL42 TaxID=3231715 RepID=UPI00345E7845
MPTCPNGHQSGSDDWCEVCGHRMAGAVPPPPPPPPPGGGYGFPPPGGSGAPGPGGRPHLSAVPDHEPELCPQCRTPREGGAPFCEECRWNFLTNTATSYTPAAPRPSAPGPGPRYPQGPGPSYGGGDSFDYQSSRPSQVNRPAEPIPFGGEPSGPAGPPGPPGPPPGPFGADPSRPVPPPPGPTPPGPGATGGAPSAFQPSGPGATSGAPSAFQPSGPAPTGGAPSAFQPSGPGQTGGAPSAFQPSGPGQTGGAPSAFQPSGPGQTGGAPSAFQPSGPAPTGGAPSAFQPSGPSAPPGYPQETGRPPQPGGQSFGGGDDDWVISPPSNSGPGGPAQGGGYGYPQPGAGQAPPGFPQAPQQPATWMATIGPDREYFMAMMQRSGPEAAGLNLPAYSPEQQRTLTGNQITIGRRRHSTGETPDIDLSVPPEDPGVSHQHAVLVQQPDGSWAVVDQNSTNGTTVNGSEEPIQPFVPVPLQDGDRVHVGAWTTITIRRG